MMSISKTRSNTRVSLNFEYKYLSENLRLKLVCENNVTLLRLKRENLSKIVALEHEKALEEIKMEQDKVNAETDQQI